MTQNKLLQEGVEELGGGSSAFSMTRAPLTKQLPGEGKKGQVKGRAALSWAATATEDTRRFIVSHHSNPLNSSSIFQTISASSPGTRRFWGGGMAGVGCWKGEGVQDPPHFVLLGEFAGLAGF